MRHTVCITLVLISLYAGAAPLNAIGHWLDQLSDSLIVSSREGDYQLQLSGHFDAEIYTIDKYPPGLIFWEDKFSFNPRLTLFLDAYAGRNLYAFAKIRADQGLDPGYHPDGQFRADEFFIQYQVGDGGALNFQVGQFGTVFGNWVGRHDSWENPFINSPVPYENITVIPDQGVQMGPSYFLDLRNRADVKEKWVPIIWGPVYTAGFAAFGELGKFAYAISLKESALSSRPIIWGGFDFGRPTVTGRVGWRPNEAWAYGFSASHGDYLQDVVKSQLPPSRSLDDFDQLTIGGDAAWAKGPIQVWAELIYSRFEVPNVGPVDTTAYYFEVKYKVSPRFYTAFRWNQQLFSSIDDGGGGTEKWDRDMIKFETALGYRFDNHFQFKLQYRFSDQDGEIEQGQQFVGAQFTIKI